MDIFDKYSIFLKKYLTQVPGDSIMIKEISRFIF